MKDDANKGRYIPVHGDRKSKKYHSGASSSSTSSKVSWRAPIIILASLVLGLGVALAHHFMNARLNGRPVADVALSQSWVSRFGTALPFLVKLAFTTSVGAAFIQHQWLSFHRQSFRVKEIDAVTSVLGNALTFFTTKICARSVSLTLIALVSW